MIETDPASLTLLMATRLSVQAAGKDAQNQIKKWAKADIVPAWQQQLGEMHADPLQEKLLVATGRASVTNATVNLRSGGINAKVSGGLSTDTVNKRGSGGDQSSFKAAEFGANRFLIEKLTFGVSKKGERYAIRNRHTQRQFLTRNRDGYVVYPAAKKIIPRVAKLWAATVVRSLHDGIEGKFK